MPLPAALSRAEPRRTDSRPSGSRNQHKRVSIAARSVLGIWSRERARYAARDARPLEQVAVCLSRPPRASVPLPAPPAQRSPLPPQRCLDLGRLPPCRHTTVPFCRALRVRSPVNRRISWAETTPCLLHWVAAILGRDRRPYFQSGPSGFLPLPH